MTTNQFDAIAKKVEAIRAAIELLRAEESRLANEFYAGSYLRREKHAESIRSTTVVSKTRA